MNIISVMILISEIQKLKIQIDLLKFLFNTELNSFKDINDMIDYKTVQLNRMNEFMLDNLSSDDKICKIVRNKPPTFDRMKVEDRKE